jgi:hypothetical protein
VASTSLVDRTIAAGKRLLTTLDRKGFPVFAAFWIFRPEEGDWRLVLGTTLVDELGPRSAYRKLQTAISGGRAAPPVPLSDITLVSSSDPLVRTLAIALRTGPTDVGEIRFSNNVINGQVIEDAFIYRLAPPDPPVQGARPAASQ